MSHLAWGRWWCSHWFSHCRHRGDRVGRSVVSVSLGSRCHDDRSLCAYTGQLVTAGLSHRMTNTETADERMRSVGDCSQHRWFSFQISIYLSGTEKIYWIQLNHSVYVDKTWNTDCFSVVCKINLHICCAHVTPHFHDCHFLLPSGGCIKKQ